VSVVPINGADATEEVAVPLALEAIGLSKRFGSVVALDDVSLQLVRGSVHALLGENGAGKSTLVKCVMGYYPPDAGQVKVGGVDAHIASPRDAAWGWSTSTSRWSTT
jgi:general nucleoside transport system ATP-binding protein